MKPAFEALHASCNTSFLVRKFEEKQFSAPYHFHPEYELTLIVAGCGKRYVGTHMQDYFPGDLVLLGSNLPHCWKTEEAPQELSRSVVVQFHEGFMGPEFFCKPELAPVSHLLQVSQHGVHFTGNTETIKTKLSELVQEPEPLKRLLLFFEVLYGLANTNNYTILDTHGTYTNLSLVEKERIHAVMAYVVENFQSKVSLKVAAATAHMTPHAFCKYFKRITRKTFGEAVTDYRIDFAARQLVHTDKPVSQVGFDSGFDDSSNFYKTFKRRMHCSPLTYRSAFVNKLA